jgi:hypothetical protein
MVLNKEEATPDGRPWTMSLMEECLVQDARA